MQQKRRLPGEHQSNPTHITLPIYILIELTMKLQSKTGSIRSCTYLKKTYPYALLVSSKIVLKAFGSMKSCFLLLPKSSSLACAAATVRLL